MDFRNSRIVVYYSYQREDKTIFAVFCLKLLSFIYSSLKTFSICLPKFDEEQKNFMMDESNLFSGSECYMSHVIVLLTRQCVMSLYAFYVFFFLYYEDLRLVVKSYIITKNTTELN